MGDDFPMRLFGWGDGMLTVWKYALEPGVTRVDAAGWDRQVLHVHEHGGAVCIWLAVSDDGKTHPSFHRTATGAAFFRVIGTGDAEPSGGRYVGTAHVGAFVWHVYLLDAEPAP